MPRLADKGTFYYYKDAKVTREGIKMASEMPAIDVITKILQYKLSRAGRNHRLYLLDGRTGSGKSTYFLQELFKRFVIGTNTRIICTEPQVVLTESNARDIKNYNANWEIGRELGIQSSQLHIEGARESITFCTTQILNDRLIKLQSKPNIDQVKKELRKIRFIIIDEVHTLDVPMISILKVLKDVSFKYGDFEEFPLIIFSSATMDVYALSSYFKMDLTDPMMCGIVSGDPNFPVDEIYLSNDEVVKYNEFEKSKNDQKTSFIIVGNYFIQTIYKDMLKDDNTSRDALIFVPGKLGIDTLGIHIRNAIVDIPVYFINEGCTTKKLIEWRSQYRNRKRVVIVGFSSGYAEASDSILANSEDTDPEALLNELKIIIATTALETGKTLYRLKYVIDMGLQTTPVNIPLSYDIRQTLNYFRQIPENKNQMVQRKGRVGRVKPGKVVHFYTKKVESMFRDTSVPQTIDNYCLSDTILKGLISKKLWNVYDVTNENDYIYPTSTDIICKSVQDLIAVGYMTIYGSLSLLYHKSLDTSKQKIYAKYLYEYLGYNLFTTSLFVVSSLKEIPNVYDVKRFKPKSSEGIMRMFIRNERPTGKIIDYIRRARHELTSAEYMNQQSFYAYYKDKAI